MLLLCCTLKTRGTSFYKVQRTYKQKERISALSRTNHHGEERIDPTWATCTWDTWKADVASSLPSYIGQGSLGPSVSLHSLGEYEEQPDTPLLSKLVSY